MKELDFALGDVFLWQEFYTNNKVNTALSVTYQLEQPRRGEFEKCVRDLHGSEFNSSLLVSGLGSTQVILGILYALSKSGIVSSAEKVPRYPFHVDLCKLLGLNWVSTSDDPDIEFVTSPNNPDGEIRLPVTTAPIVVWDAAYAWPVYGYNTTEITQSMKNSTTTKLLIPVFTFSKSHGLAGQRVGYAFISPQLQEHFPLFMKHYRDYIFLSTLGMSRSGEDTVLAVVDSYNSFPTVQHELVLRHRRISAKLTQLIPGVVVLSSEGFAYLWVYLHGINLVEALARYSIVVVPGEKFGVTNEFTRLNMMASSSSIEQLLSI